MDAFLSFCLATLQVALGCAILIGIVSSTMFAVRGQDRNLETFWSFVGTFVFALMLLAIHALVRWARF